MRNSFDNIGRIAQIGRAMYGNFSTEKAIDNYFTHCKGTHFVREEMPLDAFFEMRSEALIENPQVQLAQMCQFLGLDAPQDYLDACASIIFKKPRLSRYAIEWTLQQIEEAYQRMLEYPFLNGYTYEEGTAS